MVVISGKYISGSRKLCKQETWMKEEFTCSVHPGTKTERKPTKHSVMREKLCKVFNNSIICQSIKEIEQI